MRLLFGLFFCFSIFGFSQKISKSEALLRSQISMLDKAMQNNDSDILELLADDISFGHSNGWVQNHQDFRKDIESQKVIYDSVKEDQKSDIKINKNIANVRRTIHVKGLYKQDIFEIKLSVLEIWIKQKGNWKLWSRQSAVIKS